MQHSISILFHWSLCGWHAKLPFQVPKHQLSTHEAKCTFRAMQRWNVGCISLWMIFGVYNMYVDDIVFHMCRFEIHYSFILASASCWSARHALRNRPSKARPMYGHWAEHGQLQNCMIKKKKGQGASICQDFLFAKKFRLEWTFFFFPFLTCCWLRRVWRLKVALTKHADFGNRLPGTLSVIPRCMGLSQRRRQFHACRQQILVSSSLLFSSPWMWMISTT